MSGVDHLQELVAASLRELAQRAPRETLGEVRARALDQPAPRPFAPALVAAAARGTALIAEIKRASPSRGAIAQLDATVQAQAYQRGGAAALSVLTQAARFGGTLRDLEQARAACALPVLRKDFLVTAHQLYEARAHGADAVLLIAAALEPTQLCELRALAGELKLGVLLEVHEERELDAAGRARPDLLGINARNLRTLEVDPGTFARLAPQARGLAPLLVAESGVKTPDDVRALRAAGAGAVLVGEALAAAADPEAATRALVSA